MNFVPGGTKISGEYAPPNLPSKVTSYPKSRFCERSSGDIGVLANCKDLSVFSAYGCSNITGKFSRDFPARVTSTPLDDVSANLPRGCCVPGDIAVFEHTPNATTIDVSYTKCSGEEPSRTLPG